MAILEEIRNRTTLVLIVLGIALLGFIVSDYFGNGNQQTGPQYIGTIGGKKISSVEFEQKVQETIELYKERSQQITLPAGVEDQIREQVWAELEQDLVLLKNAEHIGVVVSPAELHDLFHGENPHPTVVQNFTDPNTGQFNPDQVAKVRNQYLEDETGKLGAQWVKLEQQIKKERQTSKYFALISKGLYITKKQAELEAKEQSTKAQINYTAMRYASIADTEVKIEEADLEHYYDIHKNEYKFQQEQEERSIEYVAFNVVPSSDDTLKVLENIQKLKEKFIETNVDTAFVQSYATQEKNIKYYTKRTVSLALDSVAFAISNKQVVGPIFDAANGTYNLVKVLDVKVAPDSVKASHILIRIAAADTAAAHRKADSLMALVKSGLPFEFIAQQNSEDEGSKKNGGDLGWFTEGQMIKSFNDASFSGNVGDLVKVESQYGIHIIKIVEQTDRLEKRLLAIVDQKVTPGSTTSELAYNTSNAFSINTTSDNFTEKAQDLGLKLADRIKAGDKTVQGLGESRAVVKWMYEAEAGAVSEPFELDNRFVVAKLTNIKPKGTLPFESAKEQIEAEVMKEKKAAIIIDKIKDTKDINGIASKWAAPVDTADNITFKSYSIPGIGNEFKVIGRTFGLQQGQTSGPIAGEFGVYVVKLNTLTVEPGADPTMQVNLLKSGYQRRAMNEGYKALKEFVGVEDNRATFY